MQYRRLGRSGLMVSVVGLGCNNFGGRIDAGRAMDVVHAALDAGITLFDTADTYGSPARGWQVADAAWTARELRATPFISAQNQYSLLNRQVEQDLVPACEHFGLGILPYFPLENGLLTGKYRRGETAPQGTRLETERFAR